MVRGESFRYDTYGAGQGSRDLSCDTGSISAQEEAAASQMALLEPLARAFEVDLSLHTYPVTNCSDKLEAMYTLRGVPPVIHYYDHDSNDQASLWTQAWAADWPIATEGGCCTSAPFDSALALRFDLAFHSPRLLGDHMRTLIDASALDDRPQQGYSLYQAFPWVTDFFPTPEVIAAQPAFGRDGGELPMECTGYAEYERFDRGDASAVPPMTDAMQLIPRVDQTVAELMQSIFPDHMTSKTLENKGRMTTKVLSSSGAHSNSYFCGNEVYYMTSRQASSQDVCQRPSASDFELACVRWLDAKYLSLEYDAEGVVARGVVEELDQGKGAAQWREQLRDCLTGGQELPCKGYV